MIINRSNLLFICIILLTIISPLDSLILNYFSLEIDPIKYLLSISSSFLLITYIFTKVKKDYKGARLIYYFLVLWSFLVLINTIPDISSSPLYYKRFLSTSFPLFLFPFIINYDFNINRLSKLIQIFSRMIPFLIAIFILCPFIFYNRNGVTMEFFSYAFATPIGILAMLSPYGDKPKRLFIYFFLLLAFLFPCIYWGRRAVTLYILFFIIGTYFFYFFFHKKTFSVKHNYKTFILILFLLFCIALFFIYRENTFYIIERFGTGFSSRQMPIDDFIYDFNQSKDWLFGRGLLGTVYSGALGLDDQGGRMGIESGWLNFILKGGIPYATIILLLCIESIINSFKAKNLLCKVLGLYIFYSIIDMTGFGVQFINLKTALFYIAISCCHSSSILNLSNEEIKSSVCKFL